MPVRKRTGLYWRLVYPRGGLVMPDSQAAPEPVACCGLYCAACRAHLRGKCPGCQANAKASWCAVRSCCRERGIASCAECAEHGDPNECKKFNNFMSRLFGVVFRSDRAACIAQIKRVGIAGHAAIMARNKAQTIRRGGSPA
jgi:hypothetical protein